MHFRPEVTGVVESPLVQIATLAEATPGAIKLCYGESDMPTPEFICRAAYEASLAGHTFYTNPAGYPELRSAIAGKIHQLHGVTYRPSEIMSTVGASMAIWVAIRTCMGAGDNAIIVAPTYAIFANAVIMAGGQPRLVALERDGARFRLDLDRVRRAIDDNTRMLIVNSPSNPTGWVMTQAEQDALLALANEHDLTVLADEVYERLAFDMPVAPSFAERRSAFENDDNLIVVNSFSKTYNMTGWRLGWAQSSERTIALMASAAEFMTSNAAAMVQQAGIVALRDGESYVGELRAHYAARRAQVSEALAAIPGVVLIQPDGAFYAFVEIERLTDSAAFAARLVREAGIAVAPGSAFGPSGEGYVRFCFAATEATLGKALGRFRDFVLHASPTLAVTSERD
jgi:aspartate/methionine/tyrosine aminotransferase